MDDISEGRSFVTKLIADPGGFKNGISEAQKALRELNGELKASQAEQKEASKVIKEAEKELKKLTREIAKHGDEDGKLAARAEELNAVIAEEKTHIERLSVAQGQLKRKIADTKDSIEEQKKAAEKLSESLEDAGGYAKKFASDLGIITAAGAAALGTLFKFDAQAAAWADDLETLSQKTGITVTELQKFQYASAIVDVSAETLAGSLDRLTISMQSAQGGSAKQKEAFEELGVAYEDAYGKIRDRQEVFYELIDALGKIRSETERDALAMNLFGRSATEINPLIKGGADQLKALGAEAEKAGLILSDNAVKGLHNFNDQLDVLKAKGGQVGRIIAEQTTPAFDELMKAGDDILARVKELAEDGTLARFSAEAGKEIGQLAKNLAGIIEWCARYRKEIIAGAGAMAGFKLSLSIGGLVTSLISAFKALAVATKAETAEMTALNATMDANPIGAVIALAGALTGALVALAATAEATADSVHMTADSLEELRKAEQDAQQRISSMNAECEVLRSLKDRYDELREVQNRSTEQQKTLDAVAGELASTLGVSADSLKDLSGNYRDLTQDVNDYLEKLREQTRFENAKNGLTAAYTTFDTLKEKIGRVKDELEGFTGFEKQAYDEYIRLNNQFGDSVFPLTERMKRYKELSDELGNLSYQMVEAGTAIAGYEKELGATGDENERLNELLAEGGIAAQDQAKNTSSAAGAVRSLTTEEKALTREKMALAEAELKEADAAQTLEDKLTEANRAVEENQLAITRKREELNKYYKETQKYEQGLLAGDEDKNLEVFDDMHDHLADLLDELAKLETEQDGYKRKVTELKAEIRAAADGTKDYTAAFEENEKQAKETKGALDSLASAYDKLNGGQMLDFNTLLDLCDKYPEYTQALLDTNGNIEAQKKVITELFEAKRQEYILTQQSAADNIKASNEETRVVLENLQKQIKAIMALAKAADILSGNNATSTLLLKSPVIQGMLKDADELEQKLAEGEKKLQSIRSRIKAVSGIDIDSFTGTGESSGSGSGSRSNDDSDKKTYRWKNKKNPWVYGEGDTQAEARMEYVQKAAEIWDWSTEKQIKAYKKILKEEQVTADERYKIELRIKNLTDKLDADAKAKKEQRAKAAEEKEKERQKRQEEREKAAQKRREERETAAEKKRLERLEYFQAAYERLVNGQISTIEKNNEDIRKKLEETLGQMDEEDKKRQQKEDDDRRRKETESIDAQLRYGRLSEFERFQLLQRRSVIEDEQKKADREREREETRAKLQAEANDKIAGGTAAIDRLTKALENMKYTVDGLTGSRTIEQIVNNASSSQVNNYISGAGISDATLARLMGMIY